MRIRIEICFISEFTCRAVTLVGNSIGARVIVKALTTLHKMRQAMQAEVDEAHSEMTSSADEAADSSSSSKEKKSRWFQSSNSQKESSKSTKSAKESYSIPDGFRIEDFDNLVSSTVLDSLLCCIHIYCTRKGSRRDPPRDTQYNKR